jgi:DNA topoisomerase-1
VARALGNTTAVCRKCYVHPAVLDCYLEGRLRAFMKAPEEKAVVALLKARIKRDARAARRSGAGGRSLAPVLARSLAVTARRLQRRTEQPVARGSS